MTPDTCINSEVINVIHDESSLNNLFVRQYCSKSVRSYEELGYVHEGLYISVLVAYFPYIMILIAGILVLVDRPFVLILFKSFNIEQIYKLLVTDDPFTEKLDKKKETHEMLSCLGTVTKYYRSYLTRTIISMLASIIPIVILVLQLVNDLYFDKLAFVCQVHGRLYACAGYPMEFYWLVLVLYISLLSVYFLLNVWNICWVLFPGMREINKIMYRYRAMNMSTTLEKIYFKNKSVQLLMGLLSSSGGVASPLRSMALMDPFLNDALVPNITNVAMGTSTVVTFSIVNGSPLDHIAQCKNCYVTFCLEYGSEVVHFQEFKTIQNITLPSSVDNILPLQLSTSINGKIVALKKIERLEF